MAQGGIEQQLEIILFVTTRSATHTQWVEARNGAKHSTAHRTTATEKHPPEKWVVPGLALSSLDPDK